MSSGVQFDEDSFSYTKPKPVGQSGGFSPAQRYGQTNYGNTEKGMTAWMMRHGIAKSPHFAQGILVAIVIINIIITFIMVKFFL